MGIGGCRWRGELEMGERREGRGATGDRGERDQEPNVKGRDIHQSEKGESEM